VTAESSREAWRSPGGIAAIATVAGVLVTVIALFVSNDQGPAVPAGEEDAYLFVYGTTMPDHLRYPMIEEFVAEATPDRVTGRLFDSGSGYPAAKFTAGPETIEGFVLRLRPERVFEARRTFTEIEAGLFEQVSVETEGGVAATAYQWIGPTDELEPIADGVWDGEES